MDSASLIRELASAGQEQVLQFWSQLDPAGQKKLAGQVAALDLKLIAQLADGYVRNKPPLALPKDIQPVQVYPRRPDGKQKELYERALQRGQQMLREGKIGAFLVAGGQGTRASIQSRPLRITLYSRSSPSNCWRIRGISAARSPGTS
jgi:UDP-N-acetylglucosamine/UDP-N-acetylgalactosamine diphosphorylase